MARGPVSQSENLAVTIHGPAGALDLVVPAAAPVTDVAREYAAQAGLAAIPLLYSPAGELLLATASLTDLGLQSGSLLVATTGVHRASAARDRPGAVGRARPGALSGLVLCLAAVMVALAGWCAAHAPDATRSIGAGLLLLAAVLGVLPVGRYAARRALVAPACAGAAVFALVWDPLPERLPMVVGLTALGASVAAGVARAFPTGLEAALKVWLVAGSLVFLVTGATTVFELAPRVAWSVLLIGGVLASRFVPILAVDVPDQFLVDFERLAVTAWSARDRATGKRVRSIVPAAAVEAVALRGAHIVTASGAAILLVTAVSAPLVLVTSELPVDRIGARILVLLSGGGLLLVARSYRHVLARGLLRGAGLVCWATLAAYLLPRLGPSALVATTVGVLGVAFLLIVVAVATGRGWRSAWWSRRAEVAEGLCVSFALASVLVSTGFFRHLWELTS
ncbi:MAG: hypothetical protein ACR2K3_07215 [Nocardioides sp.]